MISNVEHGRSAMLLDGATAAARELGVSLDWLVGLADTPTPPADLDRERVRLARVKRLARPPAPPARESDLVRVPLTRGAGIAAGAGADADAEHVVDFVPFRKDWARSHRIDPRFCRVIEVVGDSMEPALENHSVVLVDFQRTELRQNCIFALRVEDGLVVKRLHREGDDWVLASDNRAYSPQPWPEGAVVLGQVMWTGRTLQDRRRESAAQS